MSDIRISKEVVEEVVSLAKEIIAYYAGEQGETQDEVEALTRTIYLQDELVVLLEDLLRDAT